MSRIRHAFARTFSSSKRRLACSSKPCRLETVTISENERRCGQISDLNLQKGLTQFHTNGITILENAVPLGPLDHIRTRMLQDIPRNLALPNVHYNHGRHHRNVSQTPPLRAEYLHQEIWANHFAVSLISHIIGPRPQLSYATANIALPGGQGRQAVHSDCYCPHLEFPVFLEAYVFLNDVSPRNGSTELWLGTHQGYNKPDHAFPDAGWIKREVFTERAKIYPPIQPHIPKGSICVRDLRLWHAGMPNFTDVPRIMLGFIFNPRWFGSHMRLKLPNAARDKIEKWKHVDLSSITEFVDDEFDYLGFRQDLNLTQQKANGECYVPKHGSFVPGPEHYWSPGEK